MYMDDVFYGLKFWLYLQISSISTHSFLQSIAITYMQHFSDILF